ncbi:MAG: hypothetical protein H7196_05245 [candidate division SR1 bacterium]|nr:hypothetical protein [candidate division SR1 bacterium]
MKKITNDTLALVKDRKLGEAKTCINNLETAWDKDASKLSSKNQSN